MEVNIHKITPCSILFEGDRGVRVIGAVEEDISNDTTFLSKYPKSLQVVSNFLKEHGFISYYTRSWYVMDGVLKLDVGSHTEFFYIVENYEENKEKYDNYFKPVLVNPKLTYNFKNLKEEAKELEEAFNAYEKRYKPSIWS